MIDQARKDAFVDVGHHPSSSVHDQSMFFENLSLVTLGPGHELVRVR